mgnify:CR=1 FL=1
MTKANYNKKKFQDLKETIELRNAEIDELNMQLATKDKEINKFKNYITKQKYELKTLELKVDSEINNEKAKIKELDNLQQKLKEKQDIIDDKQDQIKYLRTLIDDYKLQIHNNTENLEIQLRKISKTYGGLLAQKDLIIEKIHEKRTSYIEELVILSKDEGFHIKPTNGGFAFFPLKEEGEIMTEKEYEDLPENNKESIMAKASYLKEKAERVLEKLRVMELDAMKELKIIYSKFLSQDMELKKEEYLLKFIAEDRVYEYLEMLFIEIEKGLIECYNINIEEDEEKIEELLSGFEVSILVDNSNYKHPRVIYEEDPTISNLIGSIEYENINGNYATNLSLITPGNLILANEGCIIIRLNQLANNIYSYYYLKKALLTGKVNLESSKSYLDVLSVNGLKPEAIEVNVKVILIGDYQSYDILYREDEDFKKLFPLRVEYLSNIKKDEISYDEIKKYIFKRASINKVKNIKEDGIKEIIKYLSRIARSREKINIDSNYIDKLLVLAKNKSKDEIKVEDIRDIIYLKDDIEKEILEEYRDNKMILSLNGKKIGAINALSVLDTGWCSFGKPMRLTCVVCKGEGKIIDIQKESNLSGSIHKKSINIIKGLISNLINPYEKLPVDFHLSFEQTYGIIDGDSASVAEVLCILSALSKKGIKQNIAVTGSINQFGEIQPIGGVNEKIEGFFNVCKLRKEKNIGVLIPESNLNELILNNMAVSLDLSLEDGVDGYSFLMSELKIRSRFEGKRGERL